MSLDLCLLLPSDHMLSSFIAPFVWFRLLHVRATPPDLYGAAEGYG